MNKKRYIVYFTQFSLLQHLRLNTKRIAFARECIFIESGYQRPVWIFNSRHAALNSAFSLPYISLNLHLAKLHNPRLRQTIARALYPLYRGCRFPALKWRVHFYIFDPFGQDADTQRTMLLRKKRSWDALLNSNQNLHAGRTRCRRTRAAFAEWGCRLSGASLSGNEAGAFCVCSGGGTQKKTYGLYRFDTEIVQHLQFQKSIFLHIVLFG